MHLMSWRTKKCQQYKTVPINRNILSLSISRCVPNFFLILFFLKWNLSMQVQAPSLTSLPFLIHFHFVITLIWSKWLEKVDTWHLSHRHGMQGRVLPLVKTTSLLLPSISISSVRTMHCYQNVTCTQTQAREQAIFCNLFGNKTSDLIIHFCHYFCVSLFLCFSYHLPLYGFYLFYSTMTSDLDEEGLFFLNLAINVIFIMEKD